MSRQNALPKHLQLSEMLIREIMAGRIPDGARLPPEKRMASDFGVALGTLRKALAILQEKGLLHRIQGSGNYVRAKADVASLYSFFRLELEGGGGLPTANLLDVRRERKPAGLPTFGDSPFGFRIRRLRFLNQMPIAVEEIWLDDRFASAIDSAEISDSLYFFYREKLGLVIARIEDLVSIGRVPAWTPENSGMAAGDFAGYIERTGWDQGGQPAEVSMTWFNPRTARYTSRLT